MRLLLQLAVRACDRLAASLPWTRHAREPEHLLMGRRGEDAAYFYLRRRGYTVVARNWRPPHIHGELDLVAWDDEVLCFVEVKTRSSRSFILAEAAIDISKQHTLRRAAQAFLQRLPRRAPCRFDVVSVYLQKGRPEAVQLIKNAFPLSEHHRD